VLALVSSVPNSLRIAAFSGLAATVRRAACQTGHAVCTLAARGIQFINKKVVSVGTESVNCYSFNSAG
jgi:hypothetical protein